MSRGQLHCGLPCSLLGALGELEGLALTTGKRPRVGPIETEESHEVAKANNALCAVSLARSLALILLLLFSPAAQAMGPQHINFDEDVKVTPEKDGAMIEVSGKTGNEAAEVWTVEATATAGWKVYSTDANGAPLAPSAATTTFASKAIAPLYLKLERSAPSSSDDHGYVIVDIRLHDKARVLEPTSTRYIFRVEESDQLVQTSLDEYLSAVNVGKNGDLVVRGFAVVAPDDPSHQGLPPWENPLLTPEEQDKAAAALGVSLETKKTALGVAEEGQAKDDASVGCQASDGSPHRLLALLFGLVTAAWFLGRRRRRLGIALLAVTAAGLTLVHSSQARAEARTIYGYTEYWDTLPRSDTDGYRWPTCNTGTTSCHWSDTGCCFRNMPQSKVALFRIVDSSYTLVADNTTSSTGFYLLMESDFDPDADYEVWVMFTREEAPGPLRFTNEARTSTWAISFPVELTSTYTFSWLQANSAGDTTSWAGDMATMWRVAWEAYSILVDEGDTRHYKTLGSEEDFDMVDLVYRDISGPSNAACSSSLVTIDYGQARNGDTVPHELGHIYHGRVVGCSGGYPAFPPYHDGAHWWSTGEGNSLGESIPSVLSYLAAWDPDVASSSDMQSEYFACFVDSYDNTNRLSSTRDNCYGIWEWLDTDTSNSSYTDAVDLTLKEVMDSLVTLQETSGSAGENRTADEPVYTVVPYSSCADSDDCDPGEVCLATEMCYGGDPHAGNLMDWAYHLAADQAGLSQTDVTLSFSGSPCVGARDDTYPYTGGYRFD